MNYITGILFLKILTISMGFKIIEDLNTKLREFADCTMHLHINTTRVHVDLESLATVVQIVTEPPYEKYSEMSSDGEDLFQQYANSINNHIRSLVTTVQKYSGGQCILRAFILVNFSEYYELHKELELANLACIGTCFMVILQQQNFEQELNYNSKLHLVPEFVYHMMFIWTYADKNSTGGAHNTLTIQDNFYICQFCLTQPEPVPLNSFTREAMLAVGKFWGRWISWNADLSMAAAECVFEASLIPGKLPLKHAIQTDYVDFYKLVENLMHPRNDLVSYNLSINHESAGHMPTYCFGGTSIEGSALGLYYTTR